LLPCSKTLFPTPKPHLIILKSFPGAIEKKEEKIANLDENLLRELAADEMIKEERQKKAAAKKKNKADIKARQRIAAQKKQETRTGRDEDDDDGDLATFVRKSNGKKRN
jgi:hypothetical protein